MLAPDECPGHIWIAYGRSPAKTATPRKRCKLCSASRPRKASEVPRRRGRPKATAKRCKCGLFTEHTAQANRHKCWGKMTKRKQAGKWDRIPAALAEAFKGRETGRTEAA